MKITPKIKNYKKRIDSLNAKELVELIKNSRLTNDERYAVELVDLYCKTIKEAAEIMDNDCRQVNRWLHKARLKIQKQMFK